MPAADMAPPPPGPLNSHPVQYPAKKNPTAPPTKPRSRFLEGSMNDRTSAVPPMDFIGPEDEAFERRIELHFPGEQQQQQQPQRPMQRPPPHNMPADRAATAMDNHAAHALNGASISRPISAAGSFAKKGFWGGLREKFSFSREKADAPKRPVSLDAKFAPGAVPFAGTADGKLPSREEIMANYQELMRNGFFDSHAIQSTRQPPPASMVTAAPSGPSFASRMAEPRKEWPLPTINSPSAGSQSSPSRGTKRGAPQDAETEHPEHDINLSFKRLRKSASRISNEISIPRLRKQRSQQQQQHHHAADMAAMPPPPAPLGITTRRSFSTSSRRETNRLAKRPSRINKAAISSPVPLPLTPDSDGSTTDIYALARMSVDSSNAPSFTSYDYDSSRPGSSSAGSVYTPMDVSQPTPAMSALRVRPDANRGIPNVPRIPEQFKTRPGHAGLENLVASSRPTVGQGTRRWAR
ncbi:hypothetical protein F5X68DRAFT_205476 [Plectosphaerella plurivora]|uniref:Uncharacterized protein n=1 Tax=Plectosphaerella plurivora TaxID=936078 RepID=A0A9P8VE80_9PEZI|nr:hypothetical protein F5X68DRAFT_205476 [Plectosphaerella plurivora]